MKNTEIKQQKTKNKNSKRLKNHKTKLPQKRPAKKQNINNIYELIRHTGHQSIRYVAVMALAFAAGQIMRPMKSIGAQSIIGIMAFLGVASIIFLILVSSAKSNNSSNKVNSSYNKYSKPINEIIRIHEHDKNKRD